MKRFFIFFLQAVIVLISILALYVMIRFPMTEGRAQGLDLFSIYTDPFILYGYASSVAFFVALYNAFKFLRYIQNDELFSIKSIRTLKIIRYCALLLSILIVIAGLYIKLFHAKDDDPAGFLALCIVTTFIAVTFAIGLKKLEKVLQKAINQKSR